jgi:hypothetical protein
MVEGIGTTFEQNELKRTVEIAQDIGGSIAQRPNSSGG